MSLEVLMLIAGLAAAAAVVCAVGKSKRDTEQVLVKYREMLEAARQARKAAARSRDHRPH
ncbi:MAG: hypothetical protein HRU75_03030 [Planctomycetia bacterium]|nr:MAG: hypothetical protein HRU75_03030 [Planctomycetia bacterium]